MPKRKDYHKQIIGDASLEGLGAVVTQFHTAQKMPQKLRGVPDLFIMYHGVSFWIEIKPRYANYMRDQMSDRQWQHQVGVGVRCSHLLLCYGLLVLGLVLVALSEPTHTLSGL